LVGGGSDGGEGKESKSLEKSCGKGGLGEASRNFLERGKKEGPKKRGRPPGLGITAKEKMRKNLKPRKPKPGYQETQGERKQSGEKKREPRC